MKKLLFPWYFLRLSARLAMTVFEYAQGIFPFHLWVFGVGFLLASALAIKPISTSPPPHSTPPTLFPSPLNQPFFSQQSQLISLQEAQQQAAVWQTLLHLQPTSRDALLNLALIQAATHSAARAQELWRLAQHIDPLWEGFK